MKNVELHRSHSVEIALEYFERHEMAAGIDHQATPSETRFVLDSDSRRSEALRSNLYKLKKSLQAAHDAERCRRNELGSGWCDVKLI